MFTQDILLSRVSVKGEVSNAKDHTSGHIYFTLKDHRGTLACVMFASHRHGLSFPLKEGQEVVVEGSINIYEKSGSYQLYATKIEMAGIGNLYEEFEKLKIRLEEKGMFSEIYKQPIPKYAKTIGIVTASTGAAVRDIIQISTRRNPYVQLILYPAIVQGDRAADSIVEGIRALEKQGVDTIIVGRGGGSLEDLWAFNEEKVAEAIFDCRIPIISAVGHETDVTIADYVADLRAPTPSAAAELAVFSFDDFNRRILGYQDLMKRIFSRKVMIQKNRIEQYKMRLFHGSPGYKIKENRMYLAQTTDKLEAKMEKKIRERKYALSVYIARLKGLSPLEKLSTGYAFVSDFTGKTVKDIDQIQIGDCLEVSMQNGTVKAEVKEKYRVSRDL